MSRRGTVALVLALGLLGGAASSAGDGVRARLAPDEALLANPRVDILDRDSPDNRETARPAMAPPARAPWMQLPLALLLLGAPVAGTVMLVARLAPWSAAVTRRRLRAAGYALPVAAVAGFLVYESGISAYSDICVDLLLVWPALLATLVVALASLVIDLALTVRRLRQGAGHGRRPE